MSAPAPASRDPGHVIFGAFLEALPLALSLHTARERLEATSTRARFRTICGSEGGVRRYACSSFITFIRAQGAVLTVGRLTDGLRLLREAQSGRHERALSWVALVPAIGGST
jgi:hypothetical protein